MPGPKQRLRHYAKTKAKTNFQGRDQGQDLKNCPQGSLMPRPGLDDISGFKGDMTPKNAIVTSLLLD